MIANNEFGSDPIIVKWNVIRGDTSKIKVEFLENNEVTVFDTSDWEFAATAYDPKTDIADELEVNVTNNYIEIIADPDITENWGVTYGATVAELLFDVQAITTEGTWTPIVGTINVIGDVTGSL